jgi:hypothetical protein
MYFAIHNHSVRFFYGTIKPNRCQKLHMRYIAMVRHDLGFFGHFNEVT